jgi:hypothetical protein
MSSIRLYATGSATTATSTRMRSGIANMATAWQAEESVFVLNGKRQFIDHPARRLLESSV